MPTLIAAASPIESAAKYRQGRRGFNALLPRFIAIVSEFKTRCR
jgi:hypothetical protein